MRHHRATAFALLLLASCTVTRAVTASPDPKMHLETARRTEAQLLAGAEHFSSLSLARPEMAAAAWQAAHAGLLFCEQSRPRFWCQDTSVARLQAVLQKHLGAAQLSSGSEAVEWTFAGPPECAGIIAALERSSLRGGPLHAKMTLSRCEVSSSHTDWQAALCPASGPACPDGSYPTTSSVPFDGNGPPPPAAQWLCPCRSATRPSRLEVSGRWQFEEREGAFEYEDGRVESLVDESGPMPAPPTDLSVDQLVELHLEGPLRLAALALRVLEANEPDELAARCSSLVIPQSVDVFKLVSLAKPRCVDVFLREPPPPVPPAAPAPPPSIDTSRFPPRLSVLDEARRAATEAELERISPAWDFKVSALGFIVHGSLRHGAASSEALRTEVTALASQHHRSLGFTEPPLVSENGEGFKGPRFVMQGPASFLVVNSGGGEFTGHAWPLKCAEPNAPGLVTPLLGRPIVIETRGQPCDPAGAMRCTSVPPTRRAARLGSRDVILRPAVVLTASPTPGEVEVHCAVRVELAAGVRATGPFPRLLDVVTGAQLDEVDEAALRR